MTENSSLNVDYLPPKAAELAALIGLAALIKLVEWRGGLRIYVPTPANMHADHPIAQVIGLDAAMILAGEYQGTPLEIPRCELAIRAAIHDEIRHLRQFHTEDELALRYGMCGRSIRRICARGGRDDDAQGELF